MGSRIKKREPVYLWVVTPPSHLSFGRLVLVLEVLRYLLGSLKQKEKDSQREKEHTNCRPRMLQKPTSSQHLHT